MQNDTSAGTTNEVMAKFYRELDTLHGRALWQVGGPSKKPASVPYLWRYRDYRPLLVRAAEIVPMELAARRVLIMANPGIRSDWQASSTLFANLQIIKPGEIAQAHRHTASALRLMIEGRGAYTAVDGEKSYMEPGDFVTTPNWLWHDHGNDGDEPVIWLDGLDIPLVQALEANFLELHPDPKHPLCRSDDMSQRLYGAGGLRPTWIERSPMHSPLLNYRYAQTYRTLKALGAETAGSPYDGVSIEFVNPHTGGPAMATIACFASLLPPGHNTRAHRHTGCTIYHVIEGHGRSVIAGRVFDWEAKDTFVVPGWTWHEHTADTESVLFSYSDSAALQPLGLYREEAFTENGGHQPITGKFEPLPAPQRAAGKT